MLDKASSLGLTVIRTWAFSEKFGNNALQPGPYQLNENVAQALDWVVYQVLTFKLDNDKNIYPWI